MTGSDTKRSFKSGEIIMKQGEPGKCAYIIEKGRVEILIEKDGHPPQSVGTRGSGAIIGEMALVDGAPRTATVKAIEDCEMLEISDSDFQRRLENSDPVLRMTTQVILTRYRDTLTRASIMGESTKWPGAEDLELSYTEHSSAVESIKMANEFKTALKEGQLHLHYQPIINLQTGTIAGFEALMRWEHPERGNIPPDIFIPVAEETGLIVDASKWALEESCMALKRIEQRTGHHEDLFMSVNFTSADFSADDFAQTVYQITSHSDVQPHQLHIEITERMLIAQPETAKETLAMCQKAGMSVAIDDFGTGYSSLSYLQYFPLDTLKIDRSFVSDMHKDEDSEALIKSIIALGKNMKKKIIAEGVEQAEEALMLKELDCEMAQGYYFARPMPELEATEFVKSTDIIEF